MVQNKRDLIKLSSPNILQDNINLVIDVISSENLVEGKYVLKCEEKLSKFVDIDNVVLVSNATAGLYLTIKSMGINFGDYVIVPTFTFPATANVVEHAGANVLFCDVEDDTYVLSPEKLEAVIEKNKDKSIKAIIVVHEFGYPVNMVEISRIAKKNNLLIIEDAACALGTFSCGKHVGAYSDACVFSFHPRKAITSGEGGLVVSKNKNLIDKVRMLKNHGICKTPDNKIDFVGAGLNFRITDFQAALLLGQIEYFNDELKKRKEIASLYAEGLKDINQVSLPAQHNGHSWQSFMIVLDEKIDRDSLMEFLLKNNIQTNFGAQSLPMLKYYKQKYNIQEKYYVNSMRLFQKGLVLPIYGKLNNNNIKYIINCVLSFFK